MVTTKEKLPGSRGIILFLILSCIFTVSALPRDRILKGIYINNIDVGGMSRSEALDSLYKKDRELRDRSIYLWNGDKCWTISYRDIDCHYSVMKAVDKAFEASKSYNVIDRMLILSGLKKVEEHIQMDIEYDYSKIKRIIDDISKELWVKPVDAKIEYRNGKFTVTRDLPGQEVDGERLYTMIISSLKDQRVQTALHVPVRKVTPKKTYKLLKEIKVRISSYSTSFNSSNYNRASNIRLSANSINGTVIMPGEVFSLNKVLGPRVAKNGYKKAPVIVDGKLISDFGGGVCQVASTLYNAALLANLDIVERKNHSLPLGYVGLGRDATISGDYLDLKIRNNRKYPVFIRGVVQGGTIRFIIFGDGTTPNMKVDIKSEIVEVIKPKSPRVIQDPSLPHGIEKVVVKPQNGYRVKTYRRVYINGKLIKNEQLGEDYYKPVRGKIIRGTAL